MADPESRSRAVFALILFAGVLAVTTGVVAAADGTAVADDESGQAALHAGEAAVDAASVSDIQSAIDAQEITAETSQESFFVIETEPFARTVTQGEPFTPTVTVRNNGTAEVTKNVGLIIDTDGDGSYDDESVRDWVTETLDGGESTTVTLSTATQNLTEDAATYGIFTVEQNGTEEDLDDAIEADLTVVETPFEIETEASARTVTRGEPFTLTATVQNNGTVELTKNVGLTIDTDGDGSYDDESVRDWATATLAGGESTTVTLSTQTDDLTGETGSYAVFTVERNGAPEDVDDAIQADLTITEIPFEIETEASPQTVTQGEPFTPSVTVRNNGSSEATKNVGLIIDTDGDGSYDDESVRDWTAATLAGGESTAVTLRTTTENLTADTGRYGIFTVEQNGTAEDVDDAIEANLTVTETIFEIETDPSARTVTRGELFVSSLTVRNNGTAELTKNVGLIIDADGDGSYDDESVRDWTAATLDGGESETVSLSTPTDDLPEDAASYAVFTVERNGNPEDVDDAIEGNLTVKPASDTDLPPGAVYEPGSTAAAFDTDSDGTIDIVELRAAVTAHANDEISISALANVAIAFAAR